MRIEAQPLLLGPAHERLVERVGLRRIGKQASETHAAARRSQTSLEHRLKYGDGIRYDGAWRWRSAGGVVLAAREELGPLGAREPSPGDLAGLAKEPFGTHVPEVRATVSVARDEPAAVARELR